MYRQLLISKTNNCSYKLLIVHIYLIIKIDIVYTICCTILFYCQMPQMFSSIGLDKIKKFYTIEDICRVCYSHLNGPLCKILNMLGCKNMTVFHCFHDSKPLPITPNVTHLHVVSIHCSLDNIIMSMGIQVLIITCCRSSLVLTPNIEILISVTDEGHFKYNGQLPKYLKKLFSNTDNCIRFRSNQHGADHVLPQHLTYLELFIAKNNCVTLSKYIVDIKLFFTVNSPIVLTKHIEKIKFGIIFNKPLALTKKLLHLTLGKDFNQPIDLNKKIRHLTLSYGYKYPIVLTPNIQHLEINHQCVATCNRVIEYGINNLHLTFLTNDEHICDNLPNGTKNFVLRKSLNVRKKLNNLPSGLKMFYCCPYM